jgi:hypothetical protein
VVVARFREHVVVGTLYPASMSFREFFGPLLRHVRQLTQENPRRYVAVAVPQVVDRRWYQMLLRSHRSTLLQGLLLLRGGPRAIVINSPWYLQGGDAEEDAAPAGAGVGVTLEARKPEAAA